MSINLSTTSVDNCVGVAESDTSANQQIKLPSYYNNNVEVNFYYKNNNAFTRVNNEKVKFIASGKNGSQYFEYNDESLITETVKTLNITHPIYLFAFNSLGTPTWFFEGRIYYALFKESGIPVRYLLPCYRKSDGEIGMYDIVEDKFYTNSGTGTFVKGKDI